MNKRSVFLAQPNYLFSRNAFLPYSAGVLVAFAKSIPELNDVYEFQRLIYRRENIGEMIERMRQAGPDIFGGSSYIWNFEWVIAATKAVKEAFPDCLTVLGGPHVPNRSEDFFRDYPYVDLLVHGEGEETFADVLRERLKPEPCFESVAGLSVNANGTCVKTLPRGRVNDLSKLPSPYLTGVFDDLLQDGWEFQPSWESIRGCSYKCTFCLSVDSLIDTPNGNQSIGVMAIAGGEWDVWSYDFGNQQVKVCKAVGIAKTGKNKRLVRIRFADGTVVKCTPGHQLLRTYSNRTMNNCFDSVEAWDLEKHDFVLGLQNGQRAIYQEVRSVETIPGRHDVYCMAVPETGWFFTEGKLVHNCDWGSSLFTKINKFPVNRLEKEIEWFGTHKFSLIYSCDANWGIVEQDVELTKKLVETKQRTGYPQKFRATTAKNSGDRVFRISKMLNDAGMSKGATLSVQSMDDHTLETIKRRNIPIKNYMELMKQYQKAGIGTYTEAIIGLPGESYESFARGLDTLLNAGQHAGLQCYLCSMLPNSEMNEPAYRERHKIKASKCVALNMHTSPNPDGILEWNELIIETATLPYDDWLKCCLYAWIVQGVHCLPLLRHVAAFVHVKYEVSYRAFYEVLLRWGYESPLTLFGSVLSEIRANYEGIREGKGYGIVDQRFGNIVWPPEEGGFLKLVAEGELFYREIIPFISWYFDDDEKLLWDVLDYQERVLLNPYAEVGEIALGLRHNIPEFVDGFYRDEPVPLEQGEFLYRVIREKGFNGNLEEYAREQIWYGRKSGQVQHKVERMNI